MNIAVDVYSDCGGRIGEETKGGAAQFWVGSGAQEAENNRRRAQGVWTMYVLVLEIILTVHH